MRRHVTRRQTRRPRALSLISSATPFSAAWDGDLRRCSAAFENARPLGFRPFTGFVWGCKIPIDAALDVALDFDGLYTASDDTIVELNVNLTVIVTAGGGRSSDGVRVGDLYFTDVHRIGGTVGGSTSTYAGNVRTSSGGYMPATITR